jgi:CubicO group peptidase (beta-lactamase class C family)
MKDNGCVRQDGCDLFVDSIAYLNNNFGIFVWQNYMKHIIFLLSLPLLLLLNGCRQPDSTSAVTAEFDSQISSVPDFSGVVLAADHGTILYHEAFGFRDFGKQTPLQANDIFELASVSKQFTAMIIMMLKEDGLLSFDDPVDHYLPGLPYPGITIRHLLTHTSGLPDYQAIMDQYWDKSKVAGNEDILEYLNRYHPPARFQPGEKYAYSNTGYILLGSIAEKVSGKDFHELCRERIFQKLGMTDTDLRTPAQRNAIANFAVGHIYVPEKKRYIRADSFPSSDYTIWLGHRKGPGRISSTAADLLKWDQALYSGQLISTQALTEAFMPYRLNNDSLSYYGFGWMLQPDGARVYHTGDNPGYKTIIMRFPAQQKTLIVLCNNAHQQFDSLTRALKEVFVNPE